MKCNVGYLTALIASANVGLTASVVLIAAAMAANGSFFGAVASPGFIIAAAVIAAAAAVAFYTARDYIANNCTACKTESDKMLRTLGEIITFTAVYAAALAFALLTAWIPWAGIAGMSVAMIALLPITVISTYLPLNFWRLAACMDPPNWTARIIVVASAVVLVLVILLFADQGRNLPTNPPGPPPLD